MPTITLSALALCLIPCLGVIWISQRWAGSGREMLIATGRMAVQLLAIGFALIFLFDTPNPWLGLVIVLVMIGVSALISVRVVTKQKSQALLHAGLALGVGGGLTLIFILFAVLGLQDPLYQPRVVIPMAGMVFANAMTAITLAAERLHSAQERGEDFTEARRVAWTAALIPQVNALLAVGLVSLPGMMTGQILSGVDPLIAVRYQVVVMAMILQASGYSVALFLWLSGRAERAE
jgi:putative ABC transport system permease protein